ncbi:MAG: helix-turn-helix domain-containing protein [Bacteriovoracaceae bacterium]|jgi:excisionase family DNA binding protein|nr:helix-turn-helix domain-containing protein [Bacteriovoracaceae bacterium]
MKKKVEGREKDAGVFEKEFLNSDEAANYLSISKFRLYNLTSSGRLPYMKFFRSNRYRIDDLRKLLMAEPRG